LPAPPARRCPNQEASLRPGGVLICLLIFILIRAKIKLTMKIRTLPPPYPAFRARAFPLASRPA